MESGGFWYSPYVRIIDEFGEERTLICDSVKINGEEYKSFVGTTVAVSYRHKKVLGMTVWEGKLENVNLKTSTGTEKGLTIIGAVLLITSIIVIIMGFVG